MQNFKEHLFWRTSAKQLLLDFTFIKFIKALFVKFENLGKMLVITFQHTSHTAHSRSNKYMFTFDNRNSRERCEIYSKLKIKTPERCQ